MLKTIAATLAAATLAAHHASAQTTVADTSCDGRPIAAISIDPQRPPFAGSAKKWQAIARALGLHHATTQTGVVRAYLLLEEGDVCSDARLVESERVLRTLPFLGDAHIRARRDSAGHVTIVVQTRDEVPVLASGSLRRSRPSAITLGNQNVGGLGLLLRAGVSSNAPYQSSAFVEAIDYAPFNRAVALRMQAGREALGSHVEVEAARLFLSNFQRGSWQGSYRIGDDYPMIVRPVGDNLAVQVHEERWSLGGVVRSTFGPIVTLWGPAVLGNRLSPAANAIIVTDSGPGRAADTALVARFRAFRSTRLGALFGARNVRYVTRSNLDALFAAQDVTIGWQLGTVIAPGTVSGGGNDLLLAQSALVGAASRRAVFMANAESEVRRDFRASTWESFITNVRAAAYYSLSHQVLLDVQDDFSSLGKARLPTQLSLGDPESGPRGYVGSAVAGGRRNVARAEVRVAGAHLIRGTDLGVALFSDVATMWAGDVPYGVSASRASVGFSLIGAYPSGSKRSYRVDFAFPSTRDRGRGVEVRFTSGDRTSGFTTEPGDVTQARLAPVPSSLFAWPAR